MSNSLVFAEAFLQPGINFSGPIPAVQEVLTDFVASYSLEKFSLGSCRLFDNDCLTLLAACSPTLSYLYEITFLTWTTGIFALITVLTSLQSATLLLVAVTL
jgi:hypothetical protein